MVVYHMATSNIVSTMVRRYDDVTRLAALADGEQMLQGWVDHRAISDAVVARDPVLAESRMRGHVLRTSLFLERRRAGEGAAS
jgi:DNA-binding GntR family transcriptional regulator